MQSTLCAFSPLISLRTLPNGYFPHFIDKEENWSAENLFRMSQLVSKWQNQNWHSCFFHSHAVVSCNRNQFAQKVIFALFGSVSYHLIFFLKACEICAMPINSYLHCYFEGQVTDCFFKMMQWWKCKRKITMALFAKKKWKG